MSPPKDLCGICAKSFYGKQMKISCSGHCGVRFHSKCQGLTEEQYEGYMISGVSTFLCDACRTEPDFSIRSIIPEGSFGCDASTWCDRILPTEDMNPVLCQLVEAVKSLSAEITDLKSANHQLKTEMSALRNEVVRRCLSPGPLDDARLPLEKDGPLVNEVQAGIPGSSASAPSYATVASALTKPSLPLLPKPNGRISVEPKPSTSSADFIGDVPEFDRSGDESGGSYVEVVSRKTRNVGRIIPLVTSGRIRHGRFIPRGLVRLSCRPIKHLCLPEVGSLTWLQRLGWLVL